MIALGSQSQLGIGIAISLQDQFSGTAARVSRSLRDLRNSANSNVTAAIRDSRNQYATVTAGAIGMGAAMYNTAKQGATLQHKINQIAILGGTALGKTRRELNRSMADISQSYAIMPDQVADAMLENTRAGITKNMDLITRYQAMAAQASGESLGGAQGVGSKLLGIMNAYQLPTEEFPRIANAVTAAANMSKSSIVSIGESMEYAAFTAKQFNIPLEQTLALVAKLSQSDIRGSRAGTAINNMIQYLGTSTSALASPKQKKMWAMLGLDPAQIKSMMDKGDIGNVIGEIEKASSKFGASDKLSILRGLTNMRGAPAVLGTWGTTDASSQLGSYDRATGRGTGFYGGIGAFADKNGLEAQAKAMGQDSYSDMQRVEAAWQSFKVSFVNAIAPVLGPLLKGLTYMARGFAWFADNPVGKVVVPVFAGLVGATAVIAGFRAAVLSTTLLLNALNRNQAAGGFRGLVGAGLNMYGIGGMTNAGVRRNAAGRLSVMGGRTVDFNGRTYRGGQLLPASYAIGMGAMGAQGLSGLAGTFGTRITGMLGKAGPILGGIASTGLKFLPIIGTVATIASIGMGIWDMMKENKDTEDPAKKVDRMAMEHALFEFDQLINKNSYAPITPEFMGNKQNKGKQILNQNITIVAPDGRSIFQKNFNQSMDDMMNSDLEFNLMEH